MLGLAAGQKLRVTWPGVSFPPGLTWDKEGADNTKKIALASDKKVIY